MAVSDETRRLVLERFPAFAWLLDEPEIADVLQRAVSEQWTPDTFEANFRASSWWRTRTDTQRQRADLEATDPATAANQVNAIKARLTAAGAELGGQIADDRAGALAWVAWRNGMSEQQMRSMVAGEVAPSPGAMVDVRSLAAAYMVDLPDVDAQNLARRIFAGELNLQAVEALIADRAASRFPQLAEWIKKGVRPAEYFAPHRQLIAEMTGLTADQVDLAKDPKWSRVLSHADGQTVRPMTMDETVRYVRSTDDFASSRRGQAEQASFVRDLAQQIGAMK